METTLGIFLLLTVLAGSASVFWKEWQHTQCMILTFEHARAQLAGASSAHLKSIRLAGPLSDGLSVEYRSHCGVVRLSKLDPDEDFQGVGDAN